VTERVLHFHHAWLPPSEPFVWDLIRHLPGPALVLSDEPPQNLDRFPVERIQALGHRFRWLRPRYRQRALTAMLTAWCARNRVELIHVHHGYEAVRVVGVCRRLRLPLVVSLHGHDAFGWADEHPGVFDGVLDRAAAVIVPSRFLVRRAVELGASPDRVHVIGSGVDTGYFTPSPVPKRPEALFVGRFVEKKGLDVLATAWPTVVDAVPGAALRILGYGPLEPMARRVGAAVEDTPDRERVRDAMRSARVVVTPSRTAVGDVAETLLMVNLEAQASGRPVVTTDHGGIPEYVTADETAIVVPENDAAALAEALIRVLRDDDLADRLGAAGPARAAEQDAQVVADRVRALYERVAR
jgi:glycosyltransferase involved in cell wall biosynthesis